MKFFAADELEGRLLALHAAGTGQLLLGGKTLEEAQAEELKSVVDAAGPAMKAAREKRKRKA